ncbi:MAG: NAD-dependent epimerase/dehydratase family protein [Alphaproteobacteria bacterium]|nr:NAD-dependent epimerase/dehydratase family protein [Alphaproteobacteria bacterium]MBV8549140.1 NAD-dependent epimerase/dehydratase family protein [Alphaproteobacteria bacterium]
MHDTSLPPLAFVTGATGFVGAAVARVLLNNGFRLRVLSRPNNDRRNLEGLPVEVIEGDLSSPESYREGLKGCQALFHVAADYRIWVPDPARMNQINVDGTAALLLAAAAAGVQRMVYTSSVAVLGIHKDATPSNEETPVTFADMVGVYKQSKFLAEEEVKRLIRHHQLPVVIVNPSTPIGPRDIKPTPTGRIITDAVKGLMPAYVDTGLNIAHVEDVAMGHWLAYQKGTIGERYILGGENLGLGQILAIIAEHVGRPAPTVVLPRGPLFPLAYAAEVWARLSGREPFITVDALRMAKKKMYFSSAKAIRELGYEPRPASEAIIDAITWFKAHGYC